MAEGMKKAAPPPEVLLNHPDARKVFFTDGSDRLVQLWIGKKRVWSETGGILRDGEAMLAKLGVIETLVPVVDGAVKPAQSLIAECEIDGEKVRLVTPPMQAYTNNQFARFLVAGQKYESSQMTSALLRKAESVEVPHYCKDCNKIWDYNCRFHITAALYKTVATQVPEVKTPKEKKGKKTKAAAADVPAEPVAAHPAVAASPVTFSIRAATVLNIADNVTVIPVPANSKATRLRNWDDNRTNDGMRIARWNDADPNQNCGVVASHDEGGIWFLDDDLGTLAGTLLKDTGIDISGNFTVKTADGFHYYFLQNAASRAMRFGGNANSQTIDTPGYKGEARCNNQYVMSPLSVHPDGPVYQIVNNVPLTVAPEGLLAWLQQRYELSESLKEAAKGSKKSAGRKKADRVVDDKPHGAVKNADGSVTIYPDAPVAGFKALAAAAGWAPLVRRMQEEGVEVTNASFVPGAVSPCPMPTHKHKDYTDCFGIQKSNPELVKCLGNCGFCGDLVKSVYEMDGGEAKYKTMYDAARAICEEESLHYEDYFPKQERRLAAAFSETREQAIAAEIAKGTDALTAQQIVSAKFTKAADPSTVQYASQFGPAPQRTMRLIPLSSRKPKNLVWLWENRILANKGNVLFGEPGLGKGFVGTDFIARMTTGRDFFDCENNNELYSAIVCCDEDDMDETIVPRLMLAGADMDRVFHLEIEKKSAETIEEGELRLDHDLPELSRMMAEQPDRKFIVLIDPLASYVGELDSNKDLEMKPLYLKMAKWARSNGVTLILVAHPNKNEQASALNSLSGAKSLISVFRNTWVVVRNNEDKTEKLLLSVKGNLVSEEAKKKGLRFRINNVEHTGIQAEDGEEIVDIGLLDWTGETDKDADDVRQDAAAGGTKYKQKKQDADAQDFLKSALKSGALGANELLDEAARRDISKNFLYKAKAVLNLVQGTIVGKSYWATSAADLETKKKEIGGDLGTGLRII